VLDASWMRPRQEKLARLAEIRLGHSLVVGRWNAAVERRLREEGRGHDADRVAPLADVLRPQSAYTAVRHQAAACGGLSLPRAREAVATAWKSGDTGAARLSAIRDLGLVVRPGEKQGVWVVQTAREAPVLVGALHRLVREKQAAVSAALEKENRDGYEEKAEPHHRGRAAGPGRVDDARGAAGTGSAGPVAPRLRAVLQAAVTADEIRDGVRQLLEPPPEGEGRLEQLLEAMEGMLDRLDCIEAKVDALSALAASMTSVPPGSSPRTPPKPTSGSGG